MSINGLLKMLINMALFFVYPKNRSDITGTANEPWHLRYVGKDVAKKIVEKEWTFEEYCLYSNVMPKVTKK